MAANKNDAANEALKKIERTIIQLKGLLEQIVVMRVEVAKLEFNMMNLYHTTCPGDLEGLRDDQESAIFSDNVEFQN